MEGKRVLLLNGSPRKKGTSFSFVRTIKMLVQDFDSTAQIVHVVDYFDGKESIDSLKGLTAQSDIIAMVSPLYADTLPYMDIWLLERLADEWESGLRGKGFFAVGQCGFPDITRVQPLLDACRFFSEETGMNWLGGLAYGGGAIINGAPLEDLGKKGQKITSAFKLALENVLAGREIPPKAQELMTVKIPRILYWPLAVYLNSMVKKQARAYGNVDVTRKVYLEQP